LRPKLGVIATDKRFGRRRAECRNKLPKRHTGEDGLCLKAVAMVVHFGSPLEVRSMTARRVAMLAVRYCEFSHRGR
jgi:hypothetical protein